MFGKYGNVYLEFSEKIRRIFINFEGSLASRFFLQSVTMNHFQ